MPKYLTYSEGYNLFPLILIFTIFNLESNLNSQSSIARNQSQTEMESVWIESVPVAIETRLSRGNQFPVGRLESVQPTESTASQFPVAIENKSI